MKIIIEHDDGCITEKICNAYMLAIREDEYNHVSVSGMFGDTERYNELSEKIIALAEEVLKLKSEIENYNGVIK
jgi:hypothetical protein